MIGVMYGEPWNCPERVDAWLLHPTAAPVRFEVDMRPPVDLRDLLAQQEPFITFIEPPEPPTLWERFKGFMVALAEGTDP